MEHYRLELEAIIRDGVKTKISTNYEFEEMIRIEGIYIPNERMAVGSTMDSFGQSVNEEISGTYGETVDFGVVLDNPQNIPII